MRSRNPARYSYIGKLTLRFYAHIGAGHESTKPLSCKHIAALMDYTPVSYISSINVIMSLIGISLLSTSCAL